MMNKVRGLTVITNVFLVIILLFIVSRDQYHVTNSHRPLIRMADSISVDSSPGRFNDEISVRDKSAQDSLKDMPQDAQVDAPEDELEDVPQEVPVRRIYKPQEQPMRHHEVAVYPVFGGDVPSLSKNKTKVILFWTSLWKRKGFGTGHGSEPFKKHNCYYQNCEITHDRKRYNESDIVIFHMFASTGEKLLPLPKYRRPDQLWVFFDMHPPGTAPTYGKTLSYYNGLFNLTMSGRYDSDIQVPLGKIRPYWPWEKRPTNFGNMAKNKTKMVIHFTSHCDTASKREKYVAELQKYVQLDVFGKCGIQKCPKNESSCRLKLQSQYKFILAFENRICRDYASEKLFGHGLSKNMVPIYRGGFNTHKYLPEKSVIDARDYKSPKELANYLKYLDKHDDEYNKYFEWRKMFTARKHFDLRATTVCAVCSFLHSNLHKQRHQVYHRIDEWYSKEKHCLTPHELDNKINLSKIF